MNIRAIKRKLKWMTVILLLSSGYLYMNTLFETKTQEEDIRAAVPASLVFQRPSIRPQPTLPVRNEQMNKTSLSRYGKNWLDDIQVAKYGKDYFIGLLHTSNEVIRNPIQHKPTILIWHPHNRRPVYLANPEICGGHVDCEITYDDAALNRSGAVVFRGESLRASDLPPRRKPDQLFAWWTGEKNHGGHMKEFDNYFNLTFTYRIDSGIYAPYGSLELILQELREANELSLEKLMEKKRKSRKVAAWAVSNCNARRRMELAVKIIGAGLSVDTYGACFGGRRIGNGHYSKSFYDALSEYKFYFAFENGYHCKDYMTEKFWFNGLRSGAVPIVFGPKKEDVLAVAPSKSFIHIEDYENVEGLVKYLQYLNENETAYREYLEWRTWVAHPDRIEPRLRANQRDNNLRSFCKLCRILQEEEEARRTGRPTRKMIVPSMYHFWFEMENQECIHG